MASCTRTLWKVLAGCRGQLLAPSGPSYLGISQTSINKLPVRTFAVPKVRWKDRKSEKEVKEEKEKEEKENKRQRQMKAIQMRRRVPVDDVYIKRFYSRTIHGAAEAIDLLKNFQALDFTPHNQSVYIELRLDMRLQKKKRVEPFLSTVHLPYPFKTEMNRVLVFTEDVNQAKAAQDNGAVFVGGVELIEPILEDQISADFYVAVPDIVQKLVPLKNKLRKKFPKTKKGSVSNDIPEMLRLFKTGHEYLVKNDCFVQTQIGTLDLPAEHLYANLQTIVIDVCSYRPANLGPFIERAIMSSQTSEALWFRSEDVLPKPAAETEE